MDNEDTEITDTPLGSKEITITIQKEGRITEFDPPMKFGNRTDKYIGVLTLREMKSNKLLSHRSHFSDGKEGKEKLEARIRELVKSDELYLGISDEDLFSTDN